VKFRFSLFCSCGLFDFLRFSVPFLTEEHTPSRPAFWMRIFLALGFGFSRLT